MDIFDELRPHHPQKFIPPHTDDSVVIDAPIMKDDEYNSQTGLLALINTNTNTDSQVNLISTTVRSMQHDGAAVTSNYDANIMRIMLGTQ